MVIVHGKTELDKAKYVRSNLKIKMEIESRDKGKSSIQITSLMSILNNTIFSKRNNFLRQFYDIEHNKDKLLNFRLFTIMDVDDCTEEQKRDYMTGKMFFKHWLYEYITPIYNIENLEDVMNKCNIPVTKKHDYIKVFPVNRDEMDLKQINEFHSLLEKNKKCSNMSEFLAYCIEVAEK